MRVLAFEREKQDGSILDKFDEGAAGANDQHLPEGAVARHADNHFGHVPGDHGFNQELLRPGVSGDGPRCPRDLGVIGEVEDDPAGLGLVGNRG